MPVNHFCGGVCSVISKNDQLLRGLGLCSTDPHLHSQISFVFMLTGVMSSCFEASCPVLYQR